MLGPIFNREFLTVPRRDRHPAARFAALALLWVIGVTAWQATVGFTKDAALGETARFGLLLFQITAFVQLTLLLFFSALSAASTVSQEKDRRTFVLLLLTDMRDYEIVLGKMLSLLPIAILFSITVPFFAMVLLLGGVSGAQVTQAVLVMASTALAAGSLGGLVALWRERTFQALALAVLALVFYLLIVQGVGLVGRAIGTDWSMATAWLDPFTDDVRARAAGRGGVAPAYGFVLTMLAVVWPQRVRHLKRWRNLSGEPVQQREARRTPTTTRWFRQGPRHPGESGVANPILWRRFERLPRPPAFAGQGRLRSGDRPDLLPRLA